MGLASGHVQSPERLDAAFGLAAGLYVSALVSPAVLSVVADRLGPGSALPALGVVGVALVAVVAWGTSRWNGLADVIATSRLAWALPLAGVIPVLAHFWSFVVVLGTVVADLPAPSATTTVEAAGWVLGHVAVLVGSVLVVLARSRRVAILVDDDSVSAEWEAGWARQRRYAVRIALVLAIVGPLVGLYWFRPEWVSMPVVATVLAASSLVNTLGAEHTYRATPEGLVRRRNAVSARLLPWERFDGFTVTDREIVVHRRSPRPDVRCARRDLLGDEAAVVAALDDHLDRRD